MKSRITIMVTVAVLMPASQLYASPVGLISKQSSGWDYGFAGANDHLTLANNFWSLTYTDVTRTTSYTGQAAFGNTQATASPSPLGQWLDSQGIYLPSQTPWDHQTALVLKKTFTIADTPLVSDLDLSVASDNGSTVWINGDNEGYGGYGIWFTSFWEYDNLTFSSSLLTSGTNSMYVLVLDDAPLHVNDATFSDMELTATLNPISVASTLPLFFMVLAVFIRIKRRRV